MYFLIDGDTFLPAPQEAAGNTYLLPKTTLKTLVVFSEGAWLPSNLGAAAFLLGKGGHTAPLSRPFPKPGAVSCFQKLELQRRIQSSSCKTKLFTFTKVKVSPLVCLNILRCHLLHRRYPWSFPLLCSDYAQPSEIRSRS